MCGVPFHAADGYLARLVRKGFRVAICEQVEDPKKAKGLVRREVVRVVSPGTLTDAGYLEAREPAFLMAIAPGDRRARATASRCSISRPASSRPPNTAGADGRAGARRRARGAAAARDRRRRRTSPTPAALLGDRAARGAGHRRSSGWTFEPEAARRALLDQLQTHSLDGFGLDGRAGRGQRRRRAGPVPARHAEGRPRARPRRSATAPAPTA